MQTTLKMIEKLDNLLDETEEYIKCAKMHSDDNELKSTYVDLARCHYEGYEKLSKCAERIAERKVQNMPDGGRVLREMVDWHKDKFDDRARHIKEKFDQIR